MKCNQCGGERTKDECKLCILFQSGQAPCVQTDSTFLAGMDYNQSEEFNKKPHIADRLASDLRKRGGSTKGKVYVSGMASYPGDPQAWISGKGDMVRVAEERNLTLTDPNTGRVIRRPDMRACTDEAPTGHPGLDKMKKGKKK